jgi:hypothetical protein
VFGGGGVILDLDQVQNKKYRIVISPIDAVNEGTNRLSLSI